MNATLALLYPIALALTEVVGRPITLVDLIPDNSTLVLSKTLMVSGARMRGALSGAPPEAERAVANPRLDPSWGPVEDRVYDGLMAAQLDLPQNIDDLILEQARAVFRGRSGTEERDLRAGEGATPQKRGRVTRVLVDLLVDEVENAVRVQAEEDDNG
jgi:hypothetical protein